MRLMRLNKKLAFTFWDHRAIGSYLKNFKSWCTSGMNKKNAKTYKNCIHPLVFNFEEDKMIIEVIPPPELHLMLGY